MCTLDDHRVLVQLIFLPSLASCVSKIADHVFVYDGFVLFSCSSPLSLYCLFLPLFSLFFSLTGILLQQDSSSLRDYLNLSWRQKGKREDA